jgi:hypothetical protein
MLLIKKHMWFMFYVYIFSFSCFDLLLRPSDSKQRLEYLQCCENENFTNDGLYELGSVSLIGV